MMMFRSASKYFVLSMMAAALAVGVSSCRHKDLDFDEVPMQKIDIAFDWQKAPDANPASMQVWLFFDPTESPDSTLRYDFPNKTGGSVSIPYGSFSGLALNSDNTDWAMFRNRESIEYFELYTRETNSLPTSGLRTRSLPRAREAEEETMVEAPGMAWSSRNDGMSLRRGEYDKTFTFYPEEIVCHYTVDVLDVENISSISGSATDATLSGMSGGYYHGRKSATDTRCTIPFYLVKDTARKALHGEFLTFGESPETRNPHKLALYAMMADGQKYFYTFDVADQIYNAPDPKHVHIVVHGLSLPNPVTGDNGFEPDVNDWQNIEIDLKM